MPLETLRCRSLGREIAVSRYTVSAGPGRPWAILFHEIWGLTPFINASVAALGSAGYNVFAPSYTEAYGGQASYPYADIENARNLRARYVDGEINQMADEIATEFGADIRLAVGFCWGGYAACNYALHRGGIRAVSFYGPDIEKLKVSNLTGQLHFAQKDHLIGPEKRAQVEKIAGADLAVFSDYDANHGFMCWERPAYDEQSMLKGLGRAYTYVREASTGAA